jgi:transposase
VLVYGEKTGLPFYYKKLPGNISDVTTVKNLLTELSIHGFSGVKLLMDRGFYSEPNINELYKEKIKFLIATKASLVFVRTHIDSVHDKIRGFQNYNQAYKLYSVTLPTHWDYTQKRPNKGDTIKTKKQIYVHIYYNIDKAADEEQRLDSLLGTLQNELQTEKLVEKHKNLYTKYFTVNKKIKDKIIVSPKEEAIKNTKRYYGYFVLLSNEVKDPWEALYLYRKKDVVEKAFGNCKERLNMRRLRVSSEHSLGGKLFVCFAALIILSYINTMMKEKKMYEKYTLQGLLDEIDVIRCYEFEGKKKYYGELTDKQKQIYRDMDVEAL